MPLIAEGELRRIGMARRRFLEAAGTVAVAGASWKCTGPLTARMVVERVQAALGGAWPADGVDGFKAGNPDAPVKGIVTTAMATVDVLREAIEAGANLIFTHEPTFFGREDGPAAPPTPDAPPTRPRGLGADDPVYLAKRELIKKNGLVVFRLHDNWIARKQAEMTAGLAETLGWGAHRMEDALYEIPAATAEETVAHIRGALKLRGGLRAVGDRTAEVRRVLLFPGFLERDTMWKRYREADLLLTGEVREWENTFYAADIFTAGERRALVTIGRAASEDPGMRKCAEWLGTVVQEVPTRWIPSGDLYWRAA